jgi:hypothetical protein
MTTAELANHLEQIDEANEEEKDQLLQDLLERPYKLQSQQDN